MAHEVTVTTLLDGSRRTILHIALRSDGASADLSDYEIANPADFTNMTGRDNRFFTIERIESGLNGFSVGLKFDYLVNGNFVVAVPEFDSSKDFRDAGGLKDRSDPLDGTGKILLSTEGFSGGGVGEIVLTLRKKGKR